MLSPGSKKASDSEAFECLTSGWIPDSTPSGVILDLSRLFAEWGCPSRNLIERGALSFESPMAGWHRLGNIVPTASTPVLAKHSKLFSLIDCVSVGVDRMQRNFEPMRKQVESWQRSDLTDVSAPG
jgi:hypothetical protein